MILFKNSIIAWTKSYEYSLCLIISGSCCFTLWICKIVSGLLQSQSNRVLNSIHKKNKKVHTKNGGSVSFICMLFASLKCGGNVCNSYSKWSWAQRWQFSNGQQIAVAFLRYSLLPSIVTHSGTISLCNYIIFLKMYSYFFRCSLE